MRTRPAPALLVRRQAVAWLAVLLLAGTALAACGDDDSGDDGAGTTTTVTESPDDGTTGDDGGESGEREDALTDQRDQAELAEDLAIAERIVLTAEDLPAGWTPDDEEEDDDDPEDDAEEDALDAELYECVGVEQSEVFDNENAVAESPDFNAPTSETDLTETYAGSEVNVYPTEEYARTAFAPFEDPDFESCFRDIGVRAMQEDLAEDDSGLQFSDVRVEPLDFPTLGDGTAAYRIVLVIEVEGVTIESNVDFVAILVGRIGISLDLGSFGGMFDPALAEQLAGTVVERARQA